MSLTKGNVCLVFRVSLMSAGFCLFVCFLRPSQYNSNKYIFGWHVPGGSAGWEDPLEKGMVTHSSILAWKIPWTEESGGLQSMGVAKSRT